MEVSIVNRSTFGSGILDRLDPEFVQASSLAAEEVLLRAGARPLGELGAVNCDPKVRASALEDDADVSYVDLDAVHLRDGLTIPDVVRFADRPDRAHHLLQMGDILIANVRPNRGAVTLATSALAGALASSGFSLFRSNDPGAVPFVYLFLRSAWGRRQLIRRTRGSMYPAVLPRDVEEVLVPDPPPAVEAATKVEVDTCLAEWASFFEKYDTATLAVGEFLTAIGCPPPLHETARTSADTNIVHHSEMFGPGSAHRGDAEFFRGEYDVFRTSARAAGAVRLGSLCELQQGRTKRGTDLVPTFRQGVLTNVGINWAAIVPEEGSLASSPQVSEGDVLLASMAHEAHYLGRKADYVRALPEEAAAANQAVHHLTVLRLKEEALARVSGSYLAAVLRSPFGMHQVQRCNRGVRGDHVRPDDLAREVLVPIPPSSLLSEFDELMEEAEGSRNAAVTAVSAGVAHITAWLDTFT